jgi:hypothetical protein
MTAEPRNIGGTLVRRKLSFESGFTQIPNAYMRDPRTGFKAKGILAHLMSHRDGFEVSLASLADVSDRDGLSAVRSGVEELEAAGYLVRESKRGTGAPGTYGTRWVLTEPTVPLEGIDSSCDNRTNRKGPSFDNRTNSSFDNRTHKEHHLRTSIPGTRDNPLGAAPAAPTYPKIGCTNGQHTRHRDGDRYCAVCAAPLDDA